MTTLIKLQDKFILVSDEKGKEGKNFNSALNKIDVLTRDYEEHSSEWNFCKKIISENPDFSLLSEASCLKIGYVDVEKLATDYGNIFSLEGGHRNYAAQGWVDGFKTAQSLNDKNCTCQQKIFNVEVTFENNVYLITKIIKDENN